MKVTPIFGASTLRHVGSDDMMFASIVFDDQSRQWDVHFHETRDHAENAVLEAATEGARQGYAVKLLRQL